MKEKILITGATGFLGSHILERFVGSDNYDIYATRRNQSNLYRVELFANNISWINIDSSTWKDDVIHIAPNIIINSAWTGVRANGRDDWCTQISNIVFQQDLLDIALQSNTKQFIGVGSQAEYGEFSGVVDEDYSTNPTTAYGSIKLASLEIIKHFCNINHINWTWFRLFSTFGENESDNWLIPATIKNIQAKDSMDFTEAEQRYSYLYIKDVVELFYQSCVKQHPSGVYNISSKKALPLRDIITHIQQRLNPNFILNFGALPYRENQSMLNQGDVSKIEACICPISEDDFYSKLDVTIDSYLK